MMIKDTRAYLDMPSFGGEKLPEIMSIESNLERKLIAANNKEEAIAAHEKAASQILGLIQKNRSAYLSRKSIAD